MIKIVECPECKGTGTPPWPHNVVCPRCPDCNGSGKIKTEAENPQPAKIIKEEESLKESIRKKLTQEELNLIKFK